MPTPTKSQRLFSELATDNNWSAELQGQVALAFLHQDPEAMDRFSAYVLEQVNIALVPDDFSHEALSVQGYRVQLGANGYTWMRLGDAQWQSNYSYPSEDIAWRSAHVDAVAEGLVSA
ncbi:MULTISPECIES: hypothetical protein [unclassified Variovorax]|uniref:hypothetical protein n=1 Tax=unclassified Variovorax TaxID=663243 RepID=UPI00076DB660|nr:MULTISPECIES: hypothetical protein [unclassified Variovorax]KWT98137.1 hypothetical protein APY03_0808 [Variovorax sp. WDL1]PNG50386.1 hypothetical protein CHC06_06009 [Variovorax sp. B2]PNG51259.1 hypothetical protein CHC07_05915 [Variovorax sp. B4]VTU43115.1 hypothetical protein SRS16P1_00441 [Variovorax sp. SRS16]VTU43146.1 hypothetical protein E5P1_00438 [Variovorax sp. PBL-E5]